MARKRSSLGNAITDRLEAFVSAQERILDDFDRSLRNARHFIDLAGLSMEKEPDNTEVMLEQVMEIDLLRHVTEQHESFQSIAAMLAAAQGPLEADSGALNALNKRYESLVQEAETQAERLAALLATLRVTH